MGNSLLPSRLRQAREQAGLSREQVAIGAGKSTASLISYELGRATPPLYVLVRLADLYGIRPGKLLDDLAVSDVA